MEKERETERVRQQEREIQRLKSQREEERKELERLREAERQRERPQQGLRTGAEAEELEDGGGDLGRHARHGVRIPAGAVGRAVWHRVEEREEE